MPRRDLKMEVQDLKHYLDDRFATKFDLERFATKEDLERFATKEDLKRFATKEDLKRFATKEDLERFATKEALDRLERKMDEGFIEIRGELRDRFNHMGVLFEEMKGQFQLALELLEPLLPVISAHEARIQKLEEGMIVVNLAITHRKN